MNKRAAELGLTHSNFVDPWGKRRSGQKVTARDMARLAAHIIRDYPDYYHYFGEKEFTWNKIRQLNRNPLLDAGARRRRPEDRRHAGGRLRPGRFGGAERAAADRRRQRPARPRAERGEEARKLLELGFSLVRAAVLFQPGDVVGTASVYRRRLRARSR